MSKRALITGITGQDGSYLAEYLLSKGYEVHGTIRRASTFNTQRIDHIYQDPLEKSTKLFLHYADVSEFSSIEKLIRSVEPDEIYHLAAQSHVKVSFDLPVYTGNVTGVGSIVLLEAIRRSEINSKFYQASSSEMFGSSPPPQNEETRFHPRSPYGVAKVYAYWACVNYRESYGMFASNGILFNHESPRRGEIFVTRKITRAIAAILADKQSKLYLGNLDSKRDWGFAPEFVVGMYKMLNHSKPDDFVLSTGKTTSISEFLELAFTYVGLNWKDYVKIDPKYFRPAEVDHLLGDSTKAEKELGWKARVSIEDLVKIMVDADMQLYGLKPIGDGFMYLKENGYNWTENKLTVG
ncbi:MAG: GDP-mannose 4,6-dehydratase [Candidatus Heimdallarchaeota archaeon]|nr:GDP-mannose 4,6-dehydratase [Candidatus Heimdallarchaeota archaeon]MDH5647655.1 GDP-mannose 4,6-dehydratase [Candidatus Heimdallarchaeota archaeon]